MVAVVTSAVTRIWENTVSSLLVAREKTCSMEIIASWTCEIYTETLGDLPRTTFETCLVYQIECQIY